MAVRDVVQAAAGVGGGGEYVEDVFSTYLYTGTSATQTITNGIDITGEGGMVWLKSRQDIDSHFIFDTQRSAGTYSASKWLNTNNTNAEAEQSTYGLDQFNSDGFRIFGSANQINRLDHIYASWTFRKAPKFFDVVTYTGDGTANRKIPHNLSSDVGMLIIKRTDSTRRWAVWHRSATPTNGYGALNEIEAWSSFTGLWENTAPDPAEFTVGNNADVNASGGTYVAYLFAHDAGGFGDDGEQNVISCGSYTTDGNEDATINLGYEPQWVLSKRTDAAGDWNLFDTMRGLTADTSGGGAKVLEPNTSDAELATSRMAVTSTGFKVDNFGANRTYIYIAIRRPMKTPESGTEVFAMDTQGGSSGKPNYKSGFPVDFAFVAETGSSARLNSSRLTSPNVMYFNNTNAESSDTERKFDYQNGWGNSVSVDSTRYSWMFKRAPGFMDVVAYTGTSSVRTVAHNLGVPPELIIAKNRTGRPSSDGHWQVYDKFNTATNYLILNLNAQSNPTTGAWNNTEPTSSVFTLGTLNWVNVSGEPNVAYLFASLPGVSKVGSYTGTGANLNVDCGFSAGARFILIKRTDSTGDWYVWDSLRGISAGNDPYLLLNSTVAQVTNTDYIDPLASGFTVTSSAPAALNASGGTYIFLAIA